MQMQSSHEMCHNHRSIAFDANMNPAGVFGALKSSEQEATHDEALMIRSAGSDSSVGSNTTLKLRNTAGRF